MTAKDLKNALLQEAVQGKLVPQIASEGNARDLLKEIGKERLSHGLDFANAKSGKRKSKKETALAGSNPCGISEEEIPFEIPESWCWCRLGEIVINRDRERIPLSVAEREKLTKTYDYYGASGVIDKVDKYLFDKPLLLIGEDGANLLNRSTPIAFIAKGRYWVNNHAHVLDCDDRYIFMEYVMTYINSISLAKYVTGTAQPKMNQEKMNSIPFPLPPLAEQKRIVAAIEKFMPLIEEYGKKETELKAFNEQIGALTKKAILQEAVQGKLVPQIAAEGNAKDLLERIRKERLSHGFANSYGICDGKCKKTKNSDLRSKSQIRVTEITEDEIPFDIPESWCWCRLGEICNEIKRGKSPKYADKSNFLAFAQKCNVKTGGIDLGLALYLDENSITRYSETDNLVQGDIVINSTGGGTMGRVGFYETQVPAGIKGVYPDSHVAVIRSIGNINQHYLYYVLKLNQPVLEKCGTGSTNQTELKPAVLADFVIPLPPLAEQKRIVAAIEKMLPLCEKLGE